jgi:large subunit ribosomal protein L25
VQFDAKAINKVIDAHGDNAKVDLHYGKSKHFAYLKEVQRHPVERTVIHVSVQMATQSKEVHLHLPIHFHGRDVLEEHHLMLEVHKSDVFVAGKVADMPDAVVIDAAKLVRGDHIFAKDLPLPKGLRILDNHPDAYAVVHAQREKLAELEATTPATPVEHAPVAAEAPMEAPVPLGESRRERKPKE